MKKKVLITGASGFVGGFLTDEAIRHGLDTSVTVRKSSDVSFIKHLDIDFLYPNILDADEIHAVLKDNHFDYIIHNAGVTQALTEEQYMKVNLGSVQAFTTAINKLATKPIFTFISSLAAYGPADYMPENIINDAAEPHPVTHYGRSKLAAERHLNKYADFTFKIVRPTAVYGPREKDLFQVFQIVNKGFNLAIGKGAQQLTFIYVKDLVRAIMHIAMDDSGKKCFNITDGHVYGKEDMGKFISESLGRKQLISLSIPAGIVLVLGKVNDLISKITGKSSTVNSDKVNELTARSWVTDIKALNGIGFKPEYTLREGINETVKWYKDNKWL